MEAEELMISDKLKTVFSQKIVKVKEIKQSCIFQGFPLREFL